MKIGILGGTFNPPHIGHLILAQEVKQELNLDKILFIPTNIPPHKNRDKVDARRRLNMVRLAVKGNDCFEVFDAEIKRGGVSYTIDTVEGLKKKFLKDDFYLIIGSDLANNLSTWKNSDELKKLIKIAVVRREKYPLNRKDNFIVLDITQIDISSSQIRELVHKGCAIKYLVRDNVAEYIRKHNLYGKEKQ